MKTGFVWHESYFWHDTGTGFLFPTDGKVIQPLFHPENPETKRRIKSLLDISGVTKHLKDISPRPATRDEVLRVHTDRYLGSLISKNDTGGDAGGLTPFSKGSVDIALLSAGGVIAAVEAVMNNEVENVFALVRPPGHHALADSGMGFCLFNNNAIAAKHLQQKYGLKRVAIVDWDVHHGNGAQAIFYDDPSVLTISSHQDNCFPPVSGAVSENGGGAGAGYNINIPLPPGSCHDAYIAAWERVVAPALRRFKPEFIIVASGLDASGFDPLARMLCTSETYRHLTRVVKSVAAEVCNGRMVVTHEGGYAPEYTPFCGLAIVEELSGLSGGVSDPYLAILEGQLHPIAPHEEAVIQVAENLVANIH